MDTKGIGIALKLLVVIAVLTLFAMVARLSGLLSTGNTSLQGSPTPTASVTPTSISKGSDLDALSTELENQGKNIDKMDQDFSDVDSSLSTTDVDTAAKEIDSIK